MKQLIARLSEWFWARIERAWVCKHSTVNREFDATAVTRWTWPRTRRPGRMGIELTCIWEVEARVFVFGRTFRFYDKAPFVWLYCMLQNAQYDRMNRESYGDPFGGSDPYYGHE